MTLTVFRLPGPEAFDALGPEWEALELRSDPRTPFSSPLWNRLWWKHYQKNGFVTRDEFYAHSVRSADGTLVAVAPMFRRSVPSLGPARSRFVQFFGADSSITEVRGVVCAPEDQSAVIGALIRHLTMDDRAWDMVRLDGLREPPSSARLSSGDATVQAAGTLPNYFIQLPSTWDDQLKQLKAKFKRNMRARYAALERDGHQWTLQVVTEPEPTRRALATFFDLHRARAAESGMEVRHPNRFDNPANRSFIIEYVEQMARRGDARIFELHIAGKVVGSQVAFVLGDGIWLYSSGFDPAWRKYGIMTMVTAEILKWAIAAKMKVVNLSCGQDPGKIRWNPRETIFHHCLLRAPSTRARLVMQAYEAMDASRRAVAWLKGFRSGAVRDLAES